MSAEDLDAEIKELRTLTQKALAIAKKNRELAEELRLRRKKLEQLTGYTVNSRTYRKQG